MEKIETKLLLKKLQKAYAELFAELEKNRELEKSIPYDEENMFVRKAHNQNRFSPWAG